MFPLFGFIVFGVIVISSIMIDWEFVNRLNFSFGVRRRGERTLSSSLLRLLGGIEHESSFSVLSSSLIIKLFVNFKLFIEILLSKKSANSLLLLRLF